MGLFDKMQEASFNAAEDEKIRKGVEETRNSMARKFGTSAFYGRVGNHDFAIDPAHSIFSATFEMNMQTYIIVENVSHITGYSLEPAYKDTSLGNSIVGGILFGGAGAIVGAITSKDVESATKCWLNISTDFSDFQTRQYLISTSIGQNIVRELDRLFQKRKENKLEITVNKMISAPEYKLKVDQQLKDGKLEIVNSFVVEYFPWQSNKAYHGTIGDIFFSIDPNFHEFLMLTERLDSGGIPQTDLHICPCAPVNFVNVSLVPANQNDITERYWVKINEFDDATDIMVSDEEIKTEYSILKICFSKNNFAYMGTWQIKMPTIIGSGIYEYLSKICMSKPRKEECDIPIKERLLKLKELFESDLISEEEYQKKRQGIIDGI